MIVFGYLSLVDLKYYNQFLVRVFAWYANSPGINIELGHILKCYSPRECTKDTKFLLALGINNLDLGPFQINYKYHHYRWKNKSLEGYFDPSLAEDRARDIVVGLINRYGYSWETLGRYNHYNPKNKTKNRIYYSRLYKHIYEAH